MESDDNIPGVLARGVVQAIREGRLDEAEATLQDLCSVYPQAEDYLVLPVMIQIQRGQVAEALHRINALGEERCPELKALCLFILGDASWHGYATALEDSDDPHVRAAMRQLLGKSAE